MGILRPRGTMWILMASTLGTATLSYADCAGPASLVSRFRGHPSSENAITLGGWYADRKQFSCALQVLNAALKHEPQSAQLHYLAGLALVGQGHSAEALSEVRESARLAPEVLQPHLLLGMLYDGAGQHGPAEQEWKRALEIDSSSKQALEGLSADLLARHDDAGVIRLLRDSQRTEKLSITLADAYQESQKADEAAAVLTDALKQNPGSTALVLALNELLEKQNRTVESIKLLEQATHDHPGDKEIALEYYRSLVIANDFDRATPLRQQLLAKYPHNPALLYLAGLQDKAEGHLDQAKARLEEAVRLSPDQFNYRYNLGVVLVLLKQWAEAKEQLEKAIALGAPEPQVHFELSKALRGLGQAQQASEEAKKYQELKRAVEQRTIASNKAAQADTEMTAGNTQTAISLYREATDAVPNDASYKFKLAIALDKAGKVDEERAQLEAVVKLAPNLPGAHNQLGFLLSQRGDLAGAEEQFRQAVHAAPGWTDAWLNLAMTAADNGHLDQAREAVATVLRLDPSNREARDLSDQLAQDKVPAKAHP